LISFSKRWSQKDGRLSWLAARRGNCMLSSDPHKRSAACADHLLSAIVLGKPERITPFVFLQLRSTETGNAGVEVDFTMVSLTEWDFGGLRLAVWQRLAGLAAVAVPAVVAAGTVAAAAAGSVTALTAISGSTALTSAATSLAGAGAGVAATAASIGTAATAATRMAVTSAASAAAKANAGVLLTAAGAGAIDTATVAGGAATFVGLFGSGAVTLVGAGTTITGAAMVSYSVAQYLNAAAYAFSVASAKGKSESESFHLLYQLDHSEALSGRAWSWNFWHLERGDTALELVLKVKEAHWWAFSDQQRRARLRGLLHAVLEGQPQPRSRQAERLRRAIAKVEHDFRGKPLPGTADMERRLAVAREVLRLLMTERPDDEGRTEAAQIQAKEVELDAIAQAADACVTNLQLMVDATKRTLDTKLERASRNASIGLTMAAPRRLLAALLRGSAL
jgi:hypothetical protein